MTAATAATAGAPQLVINKGLDGQQTFLFSDIERIQFVDGGLQVRGLESTHELSFADVATIHFDMLGEVSGVDDVLSDSVLRIVSHGNSITIAGCTDVVAVSIYTVSGLKMLSIPAYDGVGIDVSSLASGLYIVTVGNQSLKFVK